MDFSELTQKQAAALLGSSACYGQIETVRALLLTRSFTDNALEFAAQWSSQTPYTEITDLLRSKKTNPTPAM